MTVARDILTPLVPEAELHRHFASLMGTKGHVPAQEMLREVFARLPRPDGNFIKDFQTTGFDARIWELYICAVGLYNGFTVLRPEDSPDFLFERDGRRAWVECVTANPSTKRPPAIPGAGADNEAVLQYYENEVPIRLGGALYSKLTKVPPYWELPHVAGEPLVFAIADFSDPGWFRTNSGAIARYLYGLDAHVISPPGQPLEIVYQPFDEHVGSKTIPAGFFNLPGAKHVSAVLFSCEGTLPKFNRMGFRFDRHPFVRMIRVGGKHSFNPVIPIPDTFGYLVGEFQEEWRNGAYVFHNPRALRPIPLSFFEMLGQHWRVGNELRNRMPDFSPMTSLTVVSVKKSGAFSPADDDQVRKLLQAYVKRWDEIQARQAGFPWRERPSDRRIKNS